MTPEERADIRLGTSAVLVRERRFGPGVRAGLVTSGVALVAYAAKVIFGGLTDLRWAFLYRERTHEGVAMVQVTIRLVGGGLAGVFGLAALGVVAARSKGWTRRSLRFAVALGLVALAASAAAAMWVSVQSGCIGPCG